ncbi:MAG: 4Fe-4S binding protein [Candidatus Zixiibacteriota bacterium]
MVEKSTKTMEKEGEKVHIFEAWCKRCGICVAFCPTQALTADKDGLPVLTYPEKCTLCQMCELRCPDFAITVRRKQKRSQGAA